MRRATLAAPVLASTLWLASAAAPAAAQFTENRSILSALEPQQTLAIGGQAEGRLTADDYEYSGEIVKAYAFEGAQGAPVTIDVMSDVFDSYAYLLDPDGVIIDQDDDSGGACHARISTFLPAAGRYTIVAASLSGSTGAFTVRLADRQSPAATGPCGGGEIQDDLLELLNAVDPSGSVSVGDEVTAELVEGDPRLADGSYMKAYELIGTPGETVVVDVASRAFDALVLVVDPRGESYATDDDSGGACNARIEVTLDMQPHKVVVTSFISDGAGYYTLSVREEWGEQHVGSCPGIAQTR